jgi:hypothetical protein
MHIDRHDLISGCKLGMMVGACSLALFLLPSSTGSRVRAPATVRHGGVTAVPVTQPQFADFGAETPTSDLRWLANWVARSHDNRGAAFIIVDKRAAKLHVFDANAHLLASSAVLLGAALGDDSVPGIGLRPMGLIQVSERTTPAGRFVGERGRNASGEDVVWVDYGAAVSMHRVRLNNPSERRAERLASPTSADKRISYGCINVPVGFYEQHVRTIFSRQRAIIYVLPDTKPVQQVFGPDARVPPTAGSLQLLATGQVAGLHPTSQHASR